MSQFVMFEGHPMTPAARDAILIRRGEQPGEPAAQPYQKSKAQPGDFVKRERKRAAAKAQPAVLADEAATDAQAAADLGEAIDPAAEQAAADAAAAALYESAADDEADLGGEA